MITPGGAVDSIQVTEIYRSIQGESTRAGLPCVFVRFTGCALRCVWCDTAYAFDGGRTQSVSDVVREAVAMGTDLVEITGGEPLEQEGFYPLSMALLEAGRTVLVETGGHVSLARVDPRIVKIVDWKAPGSGMEAQNDWRNVEHLSVRDEIKIVIADRRDFEWAERKIVEQLGSRRVAALLISPVWNGCSLDEVAGWVRDSPLPLRLNLPFHKIIWGEKKGI